MINSERHKRPDVEYDMNNVNEDVPAGMACGWMLRSSANNFKGSDLESELVPRLQERY